jgi:hypothetical protein
MASQPPRHWVLVELAEATGGDEKRLWRGQYLLAVSAHAAAVLNPNATGQQPHGLSRSGVHRWVTSFHVPIFVPEVPHPCCLMSQSEATKADARLARSGSRRHVLIELTGREKVQPLQRSTPAIGSEHYAAIVTPGLPNCIDWPVWCRCQVGWAFLAGVGTPKG